MMSMGTAASFAGLRTARFVIRELAEIDATERYLDWLRDEVVRRFVYAASTTHDVAALRRYIAERTGRADVLFCGIFDAGTGIHIGNIKYEPVDSEAGYAVMGVLIGDPAFRGIGVTQEVLPATAAWLKQHRGIREVVLGVDDDNEAAVRSYRRLGFERCATPHVPHPGPGTSTMVLRL